MKFTLPRPNQRLLVTGPTDSGKSFFVRKLLKWYANVTVIDFKRDWDFQGWPCIEAFGMIRDEQRKKHLEELGMNPETLTLLEGWNLSADPEQPQFGWPVVYRVPPEDLLPQNAAALDEVARIALTERQNTLLYYDELSYVATGSDYQRRAPWFYRCITTGRSLGVAVWMSTQRPAWIPLSTLTESDYRATFYLRASEDRRRMESLIDEDIDWTSLRAYKHSFVYGNDFETLPFARLVA